MTRLSSAALSWLALAILLISAGPAMAGGYAPKLTQYAHTSWRVQDGDLGGAAYSVTQTGDGYIWVATAAGLERYDGVRFRHWKLPVEQPIYGVLADRDKSLWVSGEAHVFHVRAGGTEALDDPGGRYNGLYQDSAGAIWTARSRSGDGKGGLCRVGRPPFRCFGPAEGQPCLLGQSLTQDARGVFWLGSDIGACQWKPGQEKVIAPAADRMKNLTGVSSFSAEPDGSMLVGYARDGAMLGLQRVNESGAAPFAAGGLNGETLAVKSLLRARDDSLWIGTTKGLYHVVDGRTDHISRADGLTGDNVDGIYEDREGDIWTATSGGVDKFRLQPITALTTREGLTSEQVYAVVGRRDGSIWIGGGDGLDVLRDGVMRHMGAAEGLPGTAVSSMLEDHAGRFWLGVDNDLCWYDGKVFHVVRKPDGAKVGVMVAIVEDGRGDLWAMTPGHPVRLYRIRAGRWLDEVQLPHHAAPSAVAPAPDGAIWLVNKDNLYIVRGEAITTVPRRPVGEVVRNLTVLSDDEALLSTKAGLQRWAKGRWTLLDASRGLPCNALGAIIPDANGLVWIRAQCGVIVMARSELARLADDPKAKARVRLLDGADGAQPGFPSFRPSSAATPDGRLWFATTGPLLTVDPAHLTSNALPPPVHVERIMADHRAYELGKEIRLPPLTRDVQIDYAGLSLVASQKVRFRYRLSGVDRDWEDVDTRRSAFYMHLKPANYVFQVIAANNDGVWSPAGDSIRFSIQPAFYQTLWFQALVVLGLLALAALAIRLRLQAATHEIEARVSGQQAERVRIARELHDTLLQGFQGLLVRFQVVADAIPAGAAAKPMMEAVLNRADEILVQGRDRVRDLRSEEDGSPFQQSLVGIAFALERDGCCPIEIRSSGAPRTLDAGAQQELVAIAREAMTNACSHAQAAAINCQLIYTPSGVRLIVEDDGLGIDPAVLKAGGRSGHWGLTGMRERARQIGAALRVQRLTRGTRVEVRLNTGLMDLRRLIRRAALIGGS